MVNFLDYAWLIPVLPALAFVTVLFLGRYTPNKGGWIALAATAAAGVLSLLVFWQALKGAAPVSFDAPFKTSIEWFSIGSSTGAQWAMTLGTYIDPLSAFMLFIVGILVTLIVLYSQGYMENERNGYDADGYQINIDGRARYFAVISLFIVGMLGLIISNNYLMMFMFWEVMGLCSYLLIGFWYGRESAAAAQKKAFLVTRIGDVFFLVGLCILVVTFGSLDFDVLFATTATADQRTALLVANLCIFLGAVGKSAQFPLHVWLPDAMEGPTTVSALIHAATMVKAGVYLVARSYPLFVQTPEVLLVVAVIGGFTALFAASMALVNNDLKRVLAYSTLSQLGYMFLGLGVAGALYVGGGEVTPGIVGVALTGLTIAVFHLFSHAFFKAGLFLSAGSVGHALHSYDMRKMGGLRKWMPVTAFTMLMGTISISGIPPFSGFFSKDAIIGGVWNAYSAGAAAGSTVAYVYLALFVAALLTAFMTAYYMFRLYFMTFEGTFRGELGAHHHYPASEAESLRHAGGHGHMPHQSHELHGAYDKVGRDRPGHEHTGTTKKTSHSHHAADAAHGHGEPHEGPWTMTATLGVLAVFAIFGAIIAFAIFGGPVSDVIAPGADTRGAIGVAPEETHAAHGFVGAIVEPFTHAITYVTMAAALAGIALAWFLWGPANVTKNIKPDSEYAGTSKVLYNRYYIDHAYNWFAARVIVGWGYATEWVDRYVIDAAVNAVGKGSTAAGTTMRRTQTGNIHDYALTIVVGLLVIILAAIYLPLYVVPYVELAWNWVANLVAFSLGGGL